MFVFLLVFNFPYKYKKKNTRRYYVSSFIPCRVTLQLLAYLKNDVQGENWVTAWLCVKIKSTIQTACLHEHSIFAHGLSEYIKLNVWCLPFNFHHIVWYSGFLPCAYRNSVECTSNIQKCSLIALDSFIRIFASHTVIDKSIIVTHAHQHTTYNDDKASNETFKMRITLFDEGWIIYSIKAVFKHLTTSSMLLRETFCQITFEHLIHPSKIHSIWFLSLGIFFIWYDNSKHFQFRKSLK